MFLFKFTLVLLVTLGVASARAQVITTFGYSAENGGAWNYDPETSTISGMEGFGDLIYGIPDSQSLLAGNTFISLTGSAAEAPPGTFTVVLEDASANLASALFLWSSFTSGPRTVQQVLAFTTFDFDNIVGWSLVSGASLQAVEASFSQMSAVPEPSTFALFGLAGLLATTGRRRRA